MWTRITAPGDKLAIKPAADAMTSRAISSPLTTTDTMVADLATSRRD